MVVDGGSGVHLCGYFRFFPLCALAVSGETTRHWLVQLLMWASPGGAQLCIEMLQPAQLQGQWGLLQANQTSETHGRVAAG